MKKINSFILASLVVGGFMLGGCKKTETTTDETNNTNNNPNPNNPEFLAPTTKGKRVALLEDFTGVRCGFCPDGHVRAKAVADANPGKFIILAVHGGSYANPQTGWANFTTKYGGSIISFAKVSGYPAGTISRTLCSELGVTPQVSGGYAMSRGSWGVAASKVFDMDAPVNLGAKATFDEATRKLTVKVDMYYTSEETKENRINVALVQDHIFSRQSGAPDPNNYEQNHVLRDLLTGVWGEVITEEKKEGAKITKTFTYDVPEDYNGATIPPGGGAVVIDDLKVVVFVAQGQANVLNAIEVDVK
ncbi:MAG: Omp28-related outer membrane protein [Bacteroidia bacterium]|nr:Omp28-related outer membrane protein [Bacteroidia bacterium]